MSKRDIDALVAGYAGGRLGTPVYRAAQLIPQTATEPAFQIAGGNVLLTMIYGIVTPDPVTGVGIGNVANTLQLDTDPVSGAAVVLSTAGYNPQAAPVGTIVACSGDPAVALYAGLAVRGGMTSGAAVTGLAQGWIIPIGVIDIITTANSVSGFMRWAMWYIPLDWGATVRPV